MQRLFETAADAFTIVNDNRPDFLNTEAIDEAVGTLQVFAVFAIVLDEARHVLHHVFVTIDCAKQIAFANVLPE